MPVGCPFTSVLVGKDRAIRRIHELAEEIPGLLAFLEEKGVMPGKTATLLEVLPFNQTLTLRLAKGEATLGFAAARRIFVE